MSNMFTTRKYVAYANLTILESHDIQSEHRHYYLISESDFNELMYYIP